MSNTDNTRRINNGEALIAYYETALQGDSDCPHDAITDILHAIHARGEDTESAVRMAVSNFEDERAEEDEPIEEEMSDADET